MTYRLSKNAIKHLADKVFHGDQEVCGEIWINTNDGSAHLSREMVGQSINNRKQCVHPYESPIIYHTHPVTAYAYPSVEDINKVTKRTNYRCSIIASQWGVWQIYRTPGIDITLNLLEEKPTFKILDRYLGEMHHYTKLAQSVSKPFDKNTEPYISRCFEQINKNILARIGVEIILTPWNLINLEGYYILGM